MAWTTELLVLLVRRCVLVLGLFSNKLLLLRRVWDVCVVEFSRRLLLLLRLVEAVLASSMIETIEPVEV